MKHVFLLAAVAISLLAEKDDHPTGSRITPPTLNSVSPQGVARGTTAELTVEGLNLARASAIYFSERGVKGRILRVKELPDLPDIRLGSNGTPSSIDLGPLPPRNQVTVELDVAPDAEAGLVRFRLLTPLGLSPEGRFLIEPYFGEAPDREPNDTPEEAFETFLPAILAGAIGKPGDVDFYRIQVKAGEQLVFENGAVSLGSTLQPVVSIFDADQTLVKEYGLSSSASAVAFAHTFDKAGTYFIRISDFQSGGRASHFYRYKVGKFPLVLSAFPLGLERGKSREIRLAGYNLGKDSVTVKGEPSPEDEDAVFLRPNHSFNRIRLALGHEPDAEFAGQSVTAPVTINGRLNAPRAENRFRFRARKGEKLVIEVNARRLGSKLDSEIEVFDANERRIERAVVRPTLETSTTLNERDSASRGIRILSWTGMAVGDYVMIGGEIIRIESMPRGPDDDMIFEAFGGQRLAFADTSTEAHAIDKPVYKVQLLPPGSQPPANGLPLAHLYYRNDDGGPGYGKDSLLHFTAPADGEYIVRIRDVEGGGGDDYTYRLTIREPRPDFRLSVSPRNPNVPRGGNIPLTVTAFRMDDFDGPIEVSAGDLPKGLHATRGVIGPGQVTAVLVLSADADAKMDDAVPLIVRGGSHVANPEDKLKLIALMEKPDVLVTADTREVVLEPGGTATVALHIERQNGFGGRVPVAVMNLPPRVRILDVGLNGVLINEDETKRTFTLEALPNAEPVEQVIYVGGEIETRSPLQNTYAAPQAIRLKVERQK